MLRRKLLAKTVAAAVLACTVTVAPAVAGNVMFLKDSAISKMTDADFELLRSNARNALDYTPDGDSRRWENAATGATGVLTPLATYDQDGTLCRKLELYNEVGGFTGHSVFDLCRQPDGTWKVPAQAPAGAAPSK